MFLTAFAVCEVATWVRASNGEVFCLTRVIQSPIDVSEQVCAVLEATARFSNQLGRSSPPMMRQKRFELMGPIVTSGPHDSLLGRVVRSKVFFLLKKRHRDHTTRHHLGVERLRTPEKTHRTS